MNWTGGRLRRQSRNRPDSISKIQKQHFARARIKQQEFRQKARITSIHKHAFAFNDRDSISSSQFVVDSQPNESVDRIHQTEGLSRQSQAELPYGGCSGSGYKDLEVHKTINLFEASLKLHLSRQNLISPILISSKSIFSKGKTG